MKLESKVLMKKMFIMLALCSVSFLNVHIAEAAVPQAKSIGVISVSSSAVKEVDPNVAEISFTVESTAKSAEIANSENKLVVQKVLDSLKTKLNLASGDIIKTSNYSVRPDYTYSKEGKKTLVSYTVVNTVNIKTKNVSKVGELIDLAISNGANRLDSLSFGLMNEQSVCNDLYPQLVKNVQSQASVISRALNMNVVGVKNIKTSCNVQYSNNVMYASMGARALGAEMKDVQTPIESGKIKVNAFIDADFNIQ